MTNAYRFEEPINFPKNPYDKCIYLDQYQRCWEYSKDTEMWTNLDAIGGEENGKTN